MNKGIKLITILTLIVSIVFSVCGCILGNGNTIPEGYIAIFNGGSGEVCYKTYIYDKGNDEYDYVNVTSITEHWGSSNWKDKVTSRGTVYSKEDVFKVALDNGAFGYVKLPDGTNDIYQIDEYAEMFLGEPLDYEW